MVIANTSSGESPAHPPHSPVTVSVKVSKGKHLLTYTDRIGNTTGIFHVVGVRHI